MDQRQAWPIVPAPRMATLLKRLMPAGSRASGARGSASVTTSTSTGRAHRQRLVERRADGVGLLDPDALDAEVLATAAKSVGPKRMISSGIARLVAVELAHLGQALAECRVVVDDRHQRDVAPSGGLQLAQVYSRRRRRPRGTGPAGRCARPGAAQGCRERPAQRACSAQIGLAGVLQLDHRSGPDAAIAGIGHQHAVRRQCSADLVAEPLDPDRRAARVAQRVHRAVPARIVCCRRLGPGVAWGSAHLLPPTDPRAPGADRPRCRPRPG